MSHIVQVVSMLEVMMRAGFMVFQSREVNGAVWSGVLELERRARGVSLAPGASGPFLVMLPPGVAGASEGRDHNRRWSPEVASRSVDCFWEDGGSHSSRVTG